MGTRPDCLVATDRHPLHFPALCFLFEMEGGLGGTFEPSLLQVEVLYCLKGLKEACPWREGIGNRTFTCEQSEGSGSLVLTQLRTSNLKDLASAWELSPETPHQLMSHDT